MSQKRKLIYDDIEKGYTTFR